MEKLKSETKENKMKRKLNSAKKKKTDEAGDRSEDDADGELNTKKIKLEKKKSSVKVEVCEVAGVSWNVSNVISDRIDVPEHAAKNVIKLLEDGCTIPFIARYRKEQTGAMEVPKLREVCSLLEELRNVENKVKSAKAIVKSQDKLTKELDQAFSSAQTLTEVECLFAPFKPGQKGSLAERAKALGLEPLAAKFVSGNCSNCEANKYLNDSEKGLETTVQILDGVKHIIADMIHKDTVVMERIRKLSTNPNICFHMKKAKETQAKVKPGTKAEPAYKFEGYFDKTISVRHIKAHQVMAINRGESNKILTIKVQLNEYISRELERLCRARWLKYNMSPDCQMMIEKSIQDAYSRMIEPQICRLVRSRLTKESEKASIEVFAKNLKCLLLTSPLKGSTILALDPGFKNGCKTAVISKTGEVVATEIVYMHVCKDVAMSRSKLSQLITDHRCEVIAIGNGVACRETETFVAKLIQDSFPKLKYCIVSESGASIYSVSEAAQTEMPDLDHSLRGAVSIGRRLLDPLAEFVKVDPKHLGIGQYQHDMPQSQLKASLDSIIEECVSFVGVDVNTCSHCLLSHVSGLSSARAKNIIDFRNKFGAFICRDQLKAVKGLGAKTYEQAAGFIRIHRDVKTVNQSEVKVQVESKTTKSKGRAQKKTVKEFEPNLLDMTWIHPESYDITHRLMEKIPVRFNEIGQPQFIQAVKNCLNRRSLEDLAQELNCGVPTVKLITDALIRPLTYDLRDEFEKPLFRNAVKSIKDLSRGDVVTGRVMNVTNFGAFVDVGVGTNALIHVSKMIIQATRQKYELKLGEKVEGRIENIDIDKKRIGLQLIKVL